MTTITKTNKIDTTDLALNVKKSFRSIKTGDVVSLYFAGSDHAEDNLFLGFSDIDGAHEEGTILENLKAVKEKHGVTKNSEIEELNGGTYGMGVYAVFTDGDIKWAAYLYHGNWSYGSGAERLSCQGAWEDKATAKTRVAAGVEKARAAQKKADIADLKGRINMLQNRLAEIEAS